MELERRRRSERRTLEITPRDIRLPTQELRTKAALLEIVRVLLDSGVKDGGRTVTGVAHSQEGDSCTGYLLADAIDIPLVPVTVGVPC
jgi:hypothetical protein